MDETRNTNPKFTVGLDVGGFGRWSRLVWSALILLTFGMAILQGAQGSIQTLSFYGLTILYFFGIAIAYVVVYWLLGEQVFARSNPWLNSAILVPPAGLIVWWNAAILPFTGVAIPDALSLAMGIYIGSSFILQWRIKYGDVRSLLSPFFWLRKSTQPIACPWSLWTQLRNRSANGVKKRRSSSIAESGL